MTTRTQWREAANVLREHAEKLDRLADAMLEAESAPRSFDALTRVLALHKPNADGDRCMHCTYVTPGVILITSWPCPTVVAITGPPEKDITQ